MYLGDDLQDRICHRVGPVLVDAMAAAVDHQVAAARSGGQVLLQAGPVRTKPPRETPGTGRHFVPYFPLASGRLSSHDELTSPTERLGATPAQVPLAWLLCRSPAMVVIPGTTNPDHLRANIAAAEIAENLTDLCWISEG